MALCIIKNLLTKSDIYLKLFKDLKLSNVYSFSLRKKEAKSLCLIYYITLYFFH